MVTPRADDVRALLERHVSPLVRRVRGAQLDALARELVAREPVAERGEAERLAALVLRSVQLVEHEERLLAEEDRRWDDLAALYFGHGDDEHRRALLADRVHATVADPRRRREDLAALDRGLDFDALRERHAVARHRRLGTIEMAVDFVGRAAPRASEEVLAAGPVDGFLRERAETSPRWQIRLAALDGLLGLARAGRLPAAHLGAAVRLATDREQHAWVQGRALELVHALAHDVGLGLFARRLLEPAGGDDFLVRRLIVDALGAAGDADARALLVRLRDAQDPSEHVRLGLADALAVDELGPLLDEHEASPAVRGAAIRALARAGEGHEDAVATVTATLVDVLARERHALPLGLACEAAARLVEQRPTAGPALLSALIALSSHPARSPAEHEAAAAAAETVFRVLEPARHAWLRQLGRLARELPPGRARKLPLASLPPLPEDPDFLGRVLAELSRRDFGLTLTRRGEQLILRRGDRFRRRFWRIWHELRAPAPNKRQAFLHTVGRDARGALRAPPGGLDEVTATVVPGERVHVAAEGGWGRHLPSVDDVLDLPLLSGEPVRIYSSHGVTVLRPPARLRDRLKNRLRIALAYPELAALRLAALAGSEARVRQRYLDELATRFGVQSEFHRHSYPERALVPPHLASLFAAAAPRPDLPAALPAGERALALVPFAPAFGHARDWVEQHGYYFLSLEENGQLALVVFLAAFTALFFLEAWWKRQRIARARARIPLSIGGWGTRGKSGTERLKAAVFHGLGYEVFVKTTGCEAMLIHSVPGEPPHEVFIFRSYDKATIWEQRDMLELAADVDAEVYLWECMALNPQFVQLLEHEWMKDDLCTITNAFPDHEDVQGPAGVNVAECIASFVPRRSTLITSEQSFLPVFAETCRQRDTRLEAVTPEEADLLGADLLARFPYSEHPRNIALVARLAGELGIDRHLAIATMAEHVVPDLGVLKAYPAACVRGRTLRFMNGMSANERTGFLNNWRRMGLGEKTGPADAVVTVVNNRWDRVSRSEVFARILVEDTVADAHVLIGTNLRGLLRYVDDALDRYVAAFDLVASEAPAARLAEQLGRLRIPSPGALAERAALYARSVGMTVSDGLHAAVAALYAGTACTLAEVRREVDALEVVLVPGESPARPLPEVLEPATAAEVVEHVRRLAARVVLHARLQTLLARDPAAFPAVFRAAYRELFRAQLVVVDDPGETGDQIIDRCARAVPPGVELSVMGIQNIKGTGLDFVYRFQALDATSARLARLADDDAAVRVEALRELERFDDYGLLDAGLAAHVLAGSHGGEPAEVSQRERTLAVVSGVHEEKKRVLGQAVRRRGPGLASRLESWLDPLDSWRRRRMARRTMADLVAQRISHARAARQMRALYDRQKGGWLEEALRR